jgi:RNA polymerase sigma factor (TIGR02999 family)
LSLGVSVPFRQAFGQSAQGGIARELSFQHSLLLLHPLKQRLGLGALAQALQHLRLRRLRRCWASVLGLKGHNGLMNTDAPRPMPAPEADLASVTQWLNQFEAANPEAGNKLFELLYGELRRMARSHLRKENPGHTLSATGLAHEAWFRMAEQTRTQWKNRSHFLAVASTMMRRILINHELARRAAKRDAELVPVTLSGLENLCGSPDRDVVAVHEALLAFEALDARAAKVVELRFFGGLENEEVAEVLGVSLATVKRDWTVARAWLHRELAAR